MEGNRMPAKSIRRKFKSLVNCISNKEWDQNPKLKMIAKELKENIDARIDVKSSSQNMLFEHKELTHGHN